MKVTLKGCTFYSLDFGWDVPGRYTLPFSDILFWLINYFQHFFIKIFFKGLNILIRVNL